MKLKSILLSLSILLGFAVNSFAMSTEAQQAKQMNQTNKMFFTQTAAYATIETHAGKDNWHTLTLHNVDPKTLWFTERPSRNAGVVSTAEFINLWDKDHTSDSFTKDHPNANLVAVMDENGIKTRKQGVFVLTNPRYDSTQNTLTYDVYSIMKPFRNTAKFTEVALFIDSWGIANWGPGGWPNAR